MTGAEIVVAMVVALFGGGGLVALFKLRGETARIVVDAAQGAVIVQSSVIKDLRDQLATLEDRVGTLEGERSEAVRHATEAEQLLEATRTELDEVRRQRDLLLAANEELRTRLEHLERIVEGRQPPQP